MNELGFKVSRLIRISYGPFRLEELRANEVEEIKLSVLKSQLGSLFNLQTDQKEPSTQIKQTIRRKKKSLPDAKNPSKRISKRK
jgi:23S rRNA pseudouridine2605 synthase